MDFPSPPQICNSFSFPFNISADKIKKNILTAVSPTKKVGEGAHVVLFDVVTTAAYWYNKHLLSILLGTNIFSFPSWFKAVHTQQIWVMIAFVVNASAGYSLTAGWTVT